MLKDDTRGNGKTSNMILGKFETEDTGVVRNRFDFSKLFRINWISLSRLEYFTLLFFLLTLSWTKASELKTTGFSFFSSTALVSTTLVWEELYMIPPTTPAPTKVVNKILLPPFLGCSVALEYWRRKAAPKICFYFFLYYPVFLVFFWDIKTTGPTTYLSSETGLCRSAKSTCQSRRSKTHFCL